MVTDRFRHSGVWEVEGPRTVCSWNREFQNPERGPWSLVVFGVSATGSWRDKELGRAHMQESRKPETRKMCWFKARKSV
jgi:hypothetical protein